ncbi:unnamed protein product [Strongylus vulgaris]|uniref:Uncharacterized protein n=1 Tax=Strongylus vulgaris TaxID=40348 RepID=A0A3P7LUI8_STRVU|nr:unnamed protein product [Strongylus vulgaris]
MGLSDPGHPLGPVECEGINTQQKCTNIHRVVAHLGLWGQKRCSTANESVASVGGTGLIAAAAAASAVCRGTEQQLELI